MDQTTAAPGRDAARGGDCTGGAPATGSRPGSGAPAVGPLRAVFGNWRSVLLDMALPFLAYRALTARGAGEVPALWAAAAFPVAGVAVHWARARAVDAVGLLSLVALAAGLAIAQLAGDARSGLVAGSLPTGLVGAAFLASLLLPRPLAFYLGRQLMTGGRAELVRRWDASWADSPGFRRGTRVVSAVWGGGLLLEAAVRSLLALALPVATFLAVWPLLGYGAYGALMAWTLAYGRR